MTQPYAIGLPGTPITPGAPLGPSLIQRNGEPLQTVLIPAGTAAGSADLVFQPGGTAGGNVYVDVPTLAAAAKAIKGPKTIFVELSTAPGDHNAHIPAAGMPAGGWDFGLYVTWQGDPGVALNSGLGLVFDAGAQVASPVIFDNSNAFTSFVDLNVTSVSPGAVYSLAGAGNIPITFGGVAAVGCTLAPMFVATNPLGTLYVQLYGQAVVEPEGSAVFSGANGSYTTYDASSIIPNTINHTAHTNLATTPGANASPVQLGATPSLAAYPTTHLTSSNAFAGKPTAAPGVNAGAGATASVTRGTDTSGVVEVTTGVGSAPGNLVNVTYKIPFPGGTIPNVVISRADIGTGAGSFGVGAMTNLGFSIQTLGAVPPTDANAYSFTFIAIP